MLLFNDCCLFVFLCVSFVYFSFNSVVCVVLIVCVFV